MRNTANKTEYIKDQVNKCNKTFGHHISVIRKLKGISQEELAENTQINITTIGRLEAENINYHTTLETLFIILDSLNYPIDKFFCEKPQNISTTEKRYDLQIRKRIIGYNVATERKKQGYSQEELATISKLGKSTIQKLESKNTDRIPSIQTLLIITNALEIPFETLFKNVF